MNKEIKCKAKGQKILIDQDLLSRVLIYLIREKYRDVVREWENEFVRWAIM